MARLMMAGSTVGTGLAVFVAEEVFATAGAGDADRSAALSSSVCTGAATEGEDDPAAPVWVGPEAGVTLLK